MNSSILFIAAFLCITCSPPAHCHWILVDKEDGADNASCLQGIIPCATFNMALKGLTNNNTVILIANGIYMLEQGYETSIGPGLQQISIIGSSDTIIMCTALAGLEFNASGNIIIESVTLKNCGSQHRLTFRFAFTHNSLQLEEQFQAALYINSCYGNITLSNIAIHNSNGTGLYVYQLNGNLLIDESLIAGGIGTKAFQNQTIQNGITLSQDIDSKNKGIYHFRNTDIVDNYYYDDNEGYCIAINGGGLAIVYPALHNITIESCTISNNTKGLTHLVW